MAQQLQGDPYNVQSNQPPPQGLPMPVQGLPMPVVPAAVPVAAPAATPVAVPVVPQPRPAPAAPVVTTPQTFSFDSGQQVQYDPVTGQQTVLQPVDQNQTLATNAGLSGATVDDFLKMLGSQTAITPQERAAIYQQLGIPDLANSVFAAPSQSTTQVFNDAYGAAGLGDVKQQIIDLNSQINKARTDLTAATGSINENPWLSEASRVGRLGRLQDQAQATIGNLVNQQTQYKDLYAQGLNDINGMVTRHTADFTTNQQLNAQKLTYLVQQAEGISTATQAAKTAKLSRYLPDYLAAKTQAATPATVQFPNGASYSYDKASGQWQQLTGPQAPFASVPGPEGLPTAFNPNTGAYGVSATPASGLTTPAAVNNNPGNLRNPDGSWQNFATPQAGFQALMNDVQLKQNGNSTHNIPDGPNAGQKLTANSSLTDMMRIYAPTSDRNDPVGYANTVAKNLGISADTAIGQIPTASLAAQIAQHEDSNYWKAISQGQGQGAGSATGSLPPLVQKYAESLSTVPGSQYINADRIPKAQEDAIKIQAAGSKIPVLTGAEVSGLKSIDVIFQNLADLSTLSSQLLDSGLMGRIKGLTGNQLAAMMQTDPRFANFQQARDTAIKTVQALAGGAGSGLRLNVGEIDTAANSLPNITDNLEYATEKINGLKRLLTNQLIETLPNIQQTAGSVASGGSPSSGTTSSGVNYSIQP
jgi:phage baseplate assembly protein gpV